MSTSHQIRGSVYLQAARFLEAIESLVNSRTWKANGRSPSLTTTSLTAKEVVLAATADSSSDPVRW
jgi:hypothetical protein